ncbi:hypothetical protein ACFQ1M_15995 [Sungkyunkwania multivorans]|uniref:Lipoprotein n=1 Tax=Sungkyunkwania multivorans TaxID=1173618 RepID=A0ABW3D3P7_9FLAO
MEIFRRSGRSCTSILLSVILLFFSCGCDDSVKEKREPNYNSSDERTAPSENVYPNDRKKNIQGFEMNAKLIKELLESTEMNSEEVLAMSRKNGSMNEKQLKVFQEFIASIEENGFDVAMSDLENYMAKARISEDEFERYKNFASAMKILNDKNPSLFDPDRNDKTDRRCRLAMISLTAALASSISCDTVVSCGLAIVLGVNAQIAVKEYCEETR